MTQASFCKSRRNLLIGLLATLAPLPALHAADDNEGWRQEQSEDMRGAQGPMRTEGGEQPSEYSRGVPRDKTPSTDTARGAQGPIRTEGGEQPSEYSRGVPWRSRSDTKMRRSEAERRRQEERNRTTPESAYPTQPSMP